MKKVVKQNISEPFEQEVLVKKNATAEYWCNLQERAERKGIVRRSGIDKFNHLYFVTKTGFRFTLVD